MSGTIILFLSLLLRLSTPQTQTAGSPAYAYSSGAGSQGSSYITDGVSHVTQITVFYGTSSGGDWWGIQVTGAAALSKIPASSSTCYGTGSSQTLTLSATQRVTQVIAYKRDASSAGKYYLYRIDITLNDGSLWSKTTDTSPTNSVASTFNTPAGQEFVGFFMADYDGDCGITGFQVYYRNSCSQTTCITLDLSIFAGLSKNLFTAAQTKTFTATSSSCASCGSKEYALTFTSTPSGSTSNLIRINNVAAPTITFDTTSNTQDAQAYSVTVQARFAGQTTYITSATATFTYVNPCPSATITWTAPATVTTSVFVSAGTSVSQPYDSVSGSASQQLCGGFTYSYTMFSYPTTYVHATMQNDFGINPYTWLFVDPKFSPQEVGSYVMRHSVCLTNYPARCSTLDSNVVITACVVTSVQVVQQSDSGNLVDQSYTLLSTTQFSYQLTTKQTPNCGYASSAWAISVGTIFSGTKASFFTDSGNINTATGLYYISVSDGNNGNRLGQYTVLIASVTVDGVVYTQASLASPSSFILTASTGCSTSVVTATTVSNISVKVWDPVAFYPSPGPAFADFTDTISVAAGDPTLCPKTYTATITPTTLTTFALDTATNTFQVYSGAYTQIGTYTVTLKGTLTEVPTIFKTTTFTISVTDPCPTTSLIAPAALSDMTTSVLLGAQTQQVGVFKDSISVANGDASGTQYCGLRTYTISSTLGTASAALIATDLQISSSGLISVQTANAATIGTHIVTVVGKLTTYPTITSTLATFTITILPCVVTSLQVVQNSNQGNLIAQSYTLSSTGTLSYALTTKQTPACGYANSAWAVSATGPDPTNFQTIDATGTYQISSTTNTAQAGTYTIQVTSVTVNSITYGTSPTLVAPSSFTLTVVNPCATSTVTANTVSPIVLSVWDAVAFYPSAAAAFTEFTDFVSTANAVPTMCAKTYTASVSTLAGGISLTTFALDTATKKFQVSSQSYNQIGTFTVTLRGEITGFSTQFVTTTFTITVNDPCPTTTLIQPASLPVNMLTSVLVQASPGGSPYYETQQVGIFKDQLSVLHGDSTGTQYCSARVYSISSVIGTASTALSTTELSIVPTTGLISVYTASSATIGTHTVTVSVHLTSYTAIISTLSTFTVEIIGCVITSFTMIPLSSTNDKTYTIADPALTWNLVGSSLTTQVPPCGYTETVSSSTITTPAFVSSTAGATINYSVQSRDVANAGVHTIDVISTLDNYNFSPARIAPTCTSTFQLTAIDPCLVTVVSIAPVAVENLVAFAGYNITSLAKYAFNDTVSNVRTLNTDSQDFCGEKLLIFSLNSTAANSTIINATNQDYIHFSPPADTIDFGVAQAEVLARMKSYDTIQSAALSFTVTILGSVVPIVPDQTYIQNASPLSIQYSQFQVLPSGYDPGPSSVVAYQLTGVTSLPTYIDWSCSCLQMISGLDWIDFDATARTLTVSTSDTIYVGIHRIVLVQFFDGFAGVNPYTMFTLMINPAPVAPIMRQPPFFQPPLLPQTVVQCPDSTAKVWEYTLPEYQDPNNSPVTVSTSLDNSFFSFDNTTMTIYQKNITEKPVNKTIKVTLENQLSLKGTYSMIVQFVCSQTPVIVFNYTMKDQKDKVAKQRQWPQAYIQMIEPSGLMHVKFNQRMKIPDHPEYIQNETITLDGDTFRILELVVVPGKYSDLHKLKFNWTFVEFKTTEMLIQLDFENRGYVSSHNSEKDSIQLTIYGFQLFADALGNYMLPSTVLKTKNLPLMTSQKEAEAAQSFADSTKSAMQSAMLVNTIVSLAISGPLQQLLSSVKQLQIIVHLMLISLAYPPTSSIFFGMLMNVLTFQFYNFGNFYSKVFGLSPDSVGSNPLNDQFNMLGYNALYIIQNFGTMCWTIFVAPLAWAMAPVIVSLCQGEYAHLKVKFNRMMFFNYWVGFFNETYLFLAVCAGLNMHYFKWQLYGDAINSFVSLFFGSLIIVFPFFVAIFYNLKKNFELIKNRDENFLARFGNALIGLNFKRRGKLVFIHTCTSIFRKLWLAYMVVFQQSKPLFSIFSVNFQAIIMMMTSGLTEPMTSITANRMDLVNEAFVLITTYHLYQFTEFMTDLDNRGYVGYSLILVTVLNVLLNIGIVVISTLALSLRKLKLKYLEIKQRRRIKQQWEKKLLQVECHEIREKMRLKSEQVARRAARALKAEQKQIKNQQLFLREQQQSQAKDIVTKLKKPEFESQLIFSDPTAGQPQTTYPAKPKSSLKSKPKYSQPARTEVTRAHRSTAQRVQEETNIEVEDIEELKVDSSYELPETGMNLVNAKVKQSGTLDFSKTLKQNGKPDHKIQPEVQVPNYYDDLKDILKKFPQTSTKSLYAKNSLMQQQRIEILEVENAGKFLGLSLLQNGIEYNKWSLPKGDTSQAKIDKLRQDALNAAYVAVNDIPKEIQLDIRSGQFEAALNAYAVDRQRSKQNRSPFNDFGEYHPDMQLKQKMDLYAVLTRNRQNI